MTYLESLRRDLVGRQVVRIDGFDGGSVATIGALAFDDGTVLRFLWQAGAQDHVGVEVFSRRGNPNRNGRAIHGGCNGG
jgi:hypothetical protein